MTDHNQTVRDSFTTQATQFASNPWISNEDRINRLVAAAHLRGHERVLDVATGPGYIAEAFAHTAREVVGIDATPAMLSIAEERTRRNGLSNISFRVADALHLPFESATFELAVSRLALHHIPDPRQVISEMARVCRPGGTVLIEDIFGSEHPARSAYQDRWETLRDPSHVRTLPISELLQNFRDSGLEIDTVTTADDLRPEVERWLATTKVSATQSEEIRRLLHDDRLHDLSGTRPFQNETGALFFHARTVILVSRKLQP